MTTLVTGASGFIGGYVMRKLAKAGEPVRGFDLREPTDHPPDAEFVQGDILEPDQIAAAMDGVIHVIHAAAIAALWSPGRFDYDRVNVVGTARVLAAARRVRASTTLVSSYTTLVADSVEHDALLDENVELVPNRLLGRYPRSKRQAELVAIAAAEAGQKVNIVLPTAPVGPGDFNMTPPTVMIRDLARRKLPALLDCRLNLVDVDAVASAIIATRNVSGSGERYLLSGEDISMPDLAERISALTGVRAPKARVPGWLALGTARIEAGLARLIKRAPTAPLTGVRLAVRPCRFSNAKARAELGFAPRPLADTLVEALEWIADHG